MRALIIALTLTVLSAVSSPAADIVLRTSKRNQTAIAASTTTYENIYNGGRANETATETNAKTMVPVAGVLHGLCATLVADDRGASTITLRVNGADTALVINISNAAGAGEYCDTTHYISVAANDLINLKVVTGAGGTNFILEVLRVLYFTPTMPTQIAGAGFENVALVAPTTATTNFIPVGSDGSGRTSTTESNVTTIIEAAGTASALYCYASANTWTGTTTCRVRKNSSTTTLTCTIAGGSGATSCSDTTHTVSYAVGDTLDIELTTATGSGTFTLQGASFGFQTSNEYAEQFMASPAITEGPGASLANNVFSSLDCGHSTREGSPSGVFTIGPEDDAAITMGIAGWFRSPYDTVRSNNQVAGNFVDILRINKANSGISVTIPNSTNGTLPSPIVKGTPVAVGVTDKVTHEWTFGDSNSIIIQSCSVTLDLRQRPWVGQ